MKKITLIREIIARFCLRHEKAISKSFSFIKALFDVVDILIDFSCIGGTIYVVLTITKYPFSRSDAIHFISFFAVLYLICYVILLFVQAHYGFYDISIKEFLLSDNKWNSLLLEIMASCYIACVITWPKIFVLLLLFALFYSIFYILKKSQTSMLNRSRTEELRRLVSILNQRALLLSASAFTSDCQAGRTMRMDDLLNELSPAERKKVVIIDPNREFELLGKHFNLGGDRDAD